MARPLRLDFAGCWYRVINRDLEKRQIFPDERANLHFVRLLSVLPSVPVEPRSAKKIKGDARIVEKLNPRQLRTRVLRSRYSACKALLLSYWVIGSFGIRDFYLVTHVPFGYYRFLLLSTTNRSRLGHSNALRDLVQSPPPRP
jgi:hypothetical protein